MTAALIEIEDLSVQFPLRRTWPLGKARLLQAVNGVSLSVGEGETLALVGESGCGKTTLGRTLVGLVAPSQGRIRFRGGDLQAASPADVKAARRSVQMAFQEPFSSLDPPMTVA